MSAIAARGVGGDHAARTESEEPMGSNQLDQAGMPIDEHLRSRSDLQVTPDDTRDVDPYTRTRSDELVDAVRRWFE
jgi:hypothetical protein